MTARAIIHTIATEHRDTDRRLILTCANDVEPEDVSWLWEHWLPCGKLVAFDGAPGIGKTTLMLDLIARATQGDRMPGSNTGTTPRTVLIAGAEDGWADTIRPCLDAAAANLLRVHFVTVSNNAQFTIPDDVPQLADAIASSGASWMHIDAIMGTLAEDVRANSDHDVRRALGPLKDLAASARVLITFIRHPRKAGASSAVDAGGGSTAFSGLARAVVFAGFDPTDTSDDLNARRRVIALGKSNLGPLPPSRSFQLVSADNGRPRILWGPVSTVTADDLASAPMRLRTTTTEQSDAVPKRVAAATWLEEQLADCAVLSVDDVNARARADALAWSTVEKAAKAIGVSKRRPSRVGEPGCWYLVEAASPLASYSPAGEALVPPTVPPVRPADTHDGATHSQYTTAKTSVPPSSRQTDGTHATDKEAVPRPVPSSSLYLGNGWRDGATEDLDGGGYFDARVSDSPT